MPRASMIITLYVDHEMYILISEIAKAEKRSRTSLIEFVLDEKRKEWKKKLSELNMKGEE